jgi:triosephosphate isomerase
MEQPPLLLLHWEAFYPYVDLQKSLEQASKAKDFPHEQLRLALPYDYLRQATSTLEPGKLTFGANDMLNATASTFTGSISSKALQEAKASFVLLGKASERHAHTESTATTQHKLHQALNNQIPVFFCFGESIEEFEEGRTAEVILSQLKSAFEGIDPKQLTLVHFVYDTPVALMDKSDIEQESRDQTFKICRDQYVTLWGEEIASSLNTLCALPSHLPIPKTFFINTPFAGLYFKMGATDLTWLITGWPHTSPATKAASTEMLCVSEDQEQLPTEKQPSTEELVQIPKKRASRKKTPQEPETEQLDEPD